MMLASSFKLFNNSVGKIFKQLLARTTTVNWNIDTVY
jgi:hypothetical protein